MSGSGSPLEDTLSELGLKFSLSLQTGPSQPGTREASGSSCILISIQIGAHFQRDFLNSWCLATHSGSPWQDSSSLTLQLVSREAASPQESAVREHYGLPSPLLQRDMDA